MLGFILSPYSPALFKYKTSVVLESDLCSTIQPNLRTLWERYQD